MINETSLTEVEPKPDLETFEEAFNKRLEAQREELNRREVAFNRMPQAVRRMTRFQAESVGLYF